MKNAVFMVLIFFMFLSQGAFADGLRNLIEVAKSQADMQRVYEEETYAYRQVKKAVESGKIEKGRSEADILSRYGKPVVSQKDLDGVRDKWIYKPATSSFFSGPKICLFFDQTGIIDEIKIIE